VAAGIPVEIIMDVTSKTIRRGPSLYNPFKLLDACPFCNDAIVAKMKSAILHRGDFTSSRTIAIEHPLADSPTEHFIGESHIKNQIQVSHL
jgi:hypothetical protein